MEILTRGQLKELTPSIFTETPHNRVSDKYSFIKTIDIITKLENMDLYPVRAFQSAVRSSDANGYQRHSIRLRKKEDLYVKGIVPEMLIINGHNGRVPISFFVGLFRMICSNGMVVMEQDFGSSKFRHINLEQEHLEQLVESYANNVNNIMSVVNDYKNIILTKTEKDSFAYQAHLIAWPQGNNLEPIKLLQTKREEDCKDDLFSVFNVVQENIIKGGLSYDGKKRKVKTREIKSIQRDTEINLLLWKLLIEISGRTYNE